MVIFHSYVSLPEATLMSHPVFFAVKAMVTFSGSHPVGALGDGERSSHSSLQGPEPLPWNDKIDIFHDTFHWWLLYGMNMWIPMWIMFLFWCFTILKSENGCNFLVVLPCFELYCGFPEGCERRFQTWDSPGQPCSFQLGFPDMHRYAAKGLKIAMGDFNPAQIFLLDIFIVEMDGPLWHQGGSFLGLRLFSAIEIYLSNPTLCNLEFTSWMKWYF